MTSITAITLNALANDQARIERIASNLANVQTPGYKRELVVERSSAPSDFAQAMASLTAQGGDAVANQVGAPGPQTSLAAISRDMHTATLKPTGRPLDLALSGPGFFEVATDHGPAYTRRGEFQIDARGRLVTAEGHALLGQGGEITLTQGKPTIDAAGRVFDGDNPVAQLRVVTADSAQLSTLGAGLYASGGVVNEVPSGHVQVRQGFVENSNVDTAHEMVSLTGNVRHFEALLRVAQGRDEMLGTAIRRLGEV
ncbi:MAG TPA: flagellar hook-basal body protein [Ideonella sp.]|uniref:flagellar hook-basal body protein n=1 Tax=Ideonella sp. TaxID=1929293 RepID=UPI002E346F04|nr:flagellar hook-basal body protein [Ideonella sp.]HEX5682642.1 flagellar hook-basal body protein [Ideonella sp.]